MATMVETNRRIYGFLLFAYPREFRQQFGAEMAEVFAQMSQDQHGSSGIIRLWRLVLRELICVAIPQRLRDRTVIAGASSLIISSALMLGFFRFAS